MNQDYTSKVMQHKAVVQQISNILTKSLSKRVPQHDNSKLKGIENFLYSKANEIKRGSFGSKKETDFRDTLKTMYDLHTSKNRHHPEHHSNGFNSMNLVDLIELFCDWVACSPSEEKDFVNSLEVCKKRFNISDQLIKIFENTFRDYELGKFNNKDKPF